MTIIKTGLSVLLFFMLSDVIAGTKVIKVAANQSQFQIVLPANPTTGYQWTVLNYDKNFLNLVKSQYIAPKSQLMGAGGQMRFIFKLSPNKIHPASTTIQFKYAQPWEPQKGSLKTITVRLE